MESLESLNDFITSGHGDNIQIMCMRSESIDPSKDPVDCNWDKVFPQAESLVSIIDAALTHHREKHASASSPS